MQATLDVRTLVPGHGFLGDAEPGISGLLGYLDQLATTVSRRRDEGAPVEALLDEVPMRGIELRPDLPEPVQALIRSLHRLNVLLTYRWLEGSVPPRLR
jgi:cyclase